MLRSLVIALTLLAPALAGAEGGLRRLALLVAHPDGGPDTERLAYPERDARKLAEVLQDLGGFAAADTTVLVGPTAGEVVGALGDLERRVRAAVAQGDQAMLLVYYSGHAASGELRLGDTRLELAQVRRFLEDSRASMRVAFLDACQSGAITRLKGGTPAPGFVVDVEPGQGAQGHIIITSSTGDEASQESDDLRGSFFTHYLVSGLRGAADRSGDAQITLSEAYDYAYHRTVAHTAGTRGGTQHPTYTYDLKGNGAVVLTQLGGLAGLLFPESADGTFLVYDRDRDQVVGEVEKRPGQTRRLSLPAGRYVVKKREAQHLMLAELELKPREQRVVTSDAFVPVAFEDDVTKGPGWLAARRSFTRAFALDARAGYQSFFDAPTRDSLFLPSAVVGLRVQGMNLLAPGISAHLDATFGQSSQVLSLGPYQEPVGVDFLIAVGGVALSFDWWLGDLLLQAGPRLSGVYLRREFHGGAQPFQDLFTFSPGVEAEARYWMGDFTVGLDARAHYLRYTTEVEDRSLGFGEVFVSLGYLP